MWVFELGIGQETSNNPEDSEQNNVPRLFDFMYLHM